ncbi:hypothetical protein SALBM217S_00957 [Streptomyces griseoloalbus]
MSRWRDHIGVHRQKDGRYYVGFAPRVGRVDGTTLTKIADVAEAHGSGRVRTTVEQKMIILDVEESQVDSLVESLEALDLSARPSPFRRGTMACTGIEFCKLAIVETKARGASLIDELERRMPEFDEPITINLNGCPNACARIQVADIGLKGQLVAERPRRAGRGLPGAPRRRARPGGRLRRKVRVRSPRTSCPTTSSGSWAASRPSARTASGSPPGSAAVSEEALS